MTPLGQSSLWRTVGRHFHQDVFLIEPDIGEATRSMLASLDASDRKRLLTGLERALDGLTDAELKGLWNRSRSEILVPTKHARSFLTEMKNTVAQAIGD